MSPRLEVNGVRVVVDHGTTVLEAARQIGAEVPTLCHLEGLESTAGCMVCTVEDLESGRLLPACATRSEPGMRILTDSSRVRRERRVALELLLSDHVGDCVAPCTITCPMGLDVPAMLELVAAGRRDVALREVRAALLLPGTLAHLCPAPCESACRRREVDRPVAVRETILGLVAGSEAVAEPSVVAGPTAARIVVVGSGPAGLACAATLAATGHQVTLFEAEPAPGGSLRALAADGGVPLPLLEHEIRALLDRRVDLRCGSPVVGEKQWTDLLRSSDAVVIATGARAVEAARALGLELTLHGIAVEPGVFATSRSGVYAAGAAVRPSRLVVRMLAHGRAAASVVARGLRGEPAAAPQRPWMVRRRRLRPGEVAPHTVSPIADGDGGPADPPSRAARECLQCGCTASSTCDLRRLAAEYEADPRRFRSPSRRRPNRRDDHPELILDGGKCIRCGRCVAVARAAGEPVGLAYLGRGYDLGVGPALELSLGEALQISGSRCAAVCPTGALARRSPAPDAGETK